MQDMTGEIRNMHMVSVGDMSALVYRNADFKVGLGAPVTA